MIEMLVVTALLSALYVFLDANFDARSHASSWLSSVAQGRLWADAAELARLRGALKNGDDELPDEARLPAKTPFGGRYRVDATEHAAVVSFDDRDGGVVRVAPSVFAPTLPMHDKALLYRETPR